MQPVGPTLNLPEIDKRVLALWKKDDTFKRSLELRKNSPEYLFYDGPPFATGLPHYGHLLPGTIKDIIPRYQTMKGNYVERRFGWDTHGLPIEMLIEKELGLKGRTDIIEYGVPKFNEACRASVLRYVNDWEYVTGRLGRWVDFANDYKTMDVEFMESVWWVFKQLWEKDRIYEGLRVMPYSWRLATPLSNFEASSNYKDVQDPAVTIRCKLREKPGVSALIWTTTPWSLPSNLAICVGPDITYVEVRTKDDERVLLAEARVPAYFKNQKEIEILTRYKGTDLVGLSYESLFDFYAEERERGAFRIVADPYVTTVDGTGIVHQSPAHGEDDYRIAKLNGYAVVDPVDAEGNFTDPAKPFKGMNVKDADKEIIKALKEKGLLFKQDTLVHSYPFCERSDTPLIYKAISAWYVKVEDIRDEMMSNNQKIHWVPEYIKDGRFGNWLSQARDWNISRNRFWGNPLPVWKCDSCKEVECLGSRNELEKKIGKEVKDLHKHFVDEYTWKCSACSGTMKRIPEVLDCWVESGSMPYAQLHYPFENKERFEKAFPADFIAEGLDQTRGWFYTLMILGTSLFKQTPFKNCIVNGMILAEDGKKMSKRLKNYPDPMYVIDTYGADALRLYMINSAVVKGDSLRFSEAGVKEIVRSVLLPFWNVYSFFTTYADVDKYLPDKILTGSDNLLDRWIISRFQTLLSGIEREMGLYRLYTVVPVLLHFLEELTNWFVRRSRRRFWSDDSADKQHGYNTLYYILTGFSKALAPFLPFLTEEIYQNLRTLSKGLPDSVHLNDYPLADKKLIDAKLESEMKLIIETVSLGRALRARLNIRTRQPLKSITVVTRNESDRATLKRHEAHILEELNVKSVEFSSHEAELVTVTVKPNFPVLGPIFGKQLGEVSKTLAALPASDIEKLETGGNITVSGKELGSDAVQITRSAKQSGMEIETHAGVTVYFDTNISPELLSEGVAREFINRVQRMRKEADFHVSDRITVHYFGDTNLHDLISSHADYIKSETLAVALERVSEAPRKGSLVQEHDIEKMNVSISVTRQ